MDQCFVRDFNVAIAGLVAPCDQQALVCKVLNERPFCLIKLVFESHTAGILGPVSRLHQL